MPWRPLQHCRDASIPKLHNLRLAASAGVRVPPTWWCAAAAAARAGALPALAPGPLIVRSGSPTEDTATTSAAGQFESVILRDGDRSDLGRAVARVCASLPRDGAGCPRGAVFVQPLVPASVAGVALFDGFFWERAERAGGNQALTGGLERGEVRRGQVERDDPWSRWLAQVHAAVWRGGAAATDLEYARDAQGLVLLQARPAHFAVRRNRTLSLANHREILGDAPSAWIMSALIDAGRDALAFFVGCRDRDGLADEPYAIELRGRAWLNFSAFFRLMDRWGLPRALVTAGIGGGPLRARDHAVEWPRLWRAGPSLLRVQWRGALTVRRAPRALAALHRQIEHADGLGSLYGATVAGLRLALRTNFALAGLCTAAARVRTALDVPHHTDVVTHRMLREYDAMRSLTRDAVPRAVDAWLARWGHRGPLESDLAQPRFAEMRAALVAEVAGGGPSRWPPSSPTAGTGVLTMFERRREWFRDELMRCWQRLRARLLAVGAALAAEARLAHAEDVFALRGADIESENPLADAVEANRRALAADRALPVPTTTTEDDLRAAGAAPLAPLARLAGGSLRGVSLQPVVLEGTVRKARTVGELLHAGAGGAPVLDAHTILVVPALEPAWAVVFGRVAAVVAELGGELSHAAILLREAGRPALLDCVGAFDALEDGDTVRLDGIRGVLERVP